jgi:hypothetical protein
LGDSPGSSYHGEQAGPGIVSEETWSMEGEPAGEVGPEVGSLEYQEALETGTLPPEGGHSSSAAEPSVVTNEPQEFELGGSTTGLGVDTGD